MFRVRLATLATAAGLTLVCGCAGMNCNQSLLGRLCGRTRTTEACISEPGVTDGCCEGGCGIGGMVGDGPILMDRGPIMMAPGNIPAVPVTPDSSLPLAPTPRLVPQPQTQSQPTPYIP